MKAPGGCVHECKACLFLFSHCPDCDDGADDSWLCPRCVAKRAKAIRRLEWEFSA